MYPCVTSDLGLQFANVPYNKDDMLIFVKAIIVLNF